MIPKVCSGLVLILGLTAAVGQEPPRKDEKPPQQKSPPKPTDELTAAIAASASHPDVRMAQAKLQVAQAELDQAKLLVAQRLAAAHAKLRSAQAQVELEAQTYERLVKLESAIPKTELALAERALAQAKAALAAAEAEWQAARGQPDAGKGLVLVESADGTATLLSMLMKAQAQPQQPDQAAFNYLNLVQRTVAPPPGPATDRLRQLIGKRVTLDMKEPVPFNRAMDEFIKQAGLGDMTVRVPAWADERVLKTPPKVGPLVGEQTVAGWFQLILDDFNRSLVSGNYPSEYYQGPHEVYVRDYGLLITKKELAPPGAPTLAEFARQAQAPKPEPKK
jgi:hypothetical protein